MPSTIREFIDRLAPTQLIPRAELEAFVARGNSGDSDAESTALAADLVRSGRISAFQAERLSHNEPLLIDDYVLLEQRGAGGMAQVFKARHRVMGRVVALKLIRERPGAGRQAVGRFQREIKAVAALDHPHIVRAYDAGEADGTYFLVMEYVEGEDLAHHVRRIGALAPRLAIDYTRQAAVGLEYAHQQGIIHRDVKPSNLMLTPDGRVRVLDLGLARLQHPADVSGEDVTDAVTETGDLLGTAAYMAPEQSQNPHLVDHRCDIYSLGCTLYYLLTGRTVYGGSSYVEKVLAHRQAEPPPLKIESGDLPVELQSAFHKMIAKEPSARFQAMREVIEALDRVSGPTPQAPADVRPGTPAVKPQRPGQGLVWGAALLASLAAAIWVVALRRGDGGSDSQSVTPASQTSREDVPDVIPGTVLPDDSGGATTVPPLDRQAAERRAAERVLELHGSVDVFDGQSLHTGVARMEGLPSGAYQIIRVSLAGTRVKDADLKDLGGRTKLELLNLADTSIGSNGIDLLSGLPELSTLYLSDTRVDNACMPTICGFPGLQELDLRGTRVDDTGLQELLQCRSLRKLRLGEGQPLTRDAAATIAQMTWLTSLGVRDLPIDDAAMEQLSKLSGLTWLDLGSTDITNSSVPQLSRMTQLSYLHFDGTDITNDQAEILRQSLPLWKEPD